MTIKFNQYWTIIPERTEEYNKFIIKEFIPTVNRWDMHVVAGWTVLVGAYCEIMLESVSSDLCVVEKALTDPKYRLLNEKLLTYVKNYKTKILVSTGRKNAYSRDIKQNTVKFIQVWDIAKNRQTEYERFVSLEYYPKLEELGISVAGEWAVLLGEGPGIICEGRIQDIEHLAKILHSDKFRKARSELRKYVGNYASRLLAFHVQKVLGYKSVSYEIFY